ncbi:1-aminocyclopropane-1-carboxylate deaminase/D-cysteine desulfhydrase [Nonomuraea sp. NPDC049480]|uniref:1-aminocyclopropane-1-carboxylate deaminase/D-cysteine desulfhydrase n=1 Tax=Nonomuraea sp. NPDC049480 TaxID=3364353 RepID=UPI00379B776B
MILPVPDTPLHPLPNLARRLGMDPGELWVKREDLTGLAGGGNKARKLAAIVADAVARGCDHLVTGGGAQSNHARMTAAAANIAGLGCDLVLTPGDESGNLLLDRVLGARIRVLDGGPLPYAELEAAIEARARELAGQGRRPYAIPIGGSTALGAAAYAPVARELAERLDPGLVVVAAGSGGTQAGLAAGFGDHGKVLGIDVGARPGLAAAIEELAAGAADHAGLPAPTGRCRLDPAQAGEGYGVPTDAALAALRAAARADALLLDPVYTAKAMAGLFAAVRELPQGTRVVFVHTGGLPGLLATRYADWLTSATPASSAAGPAATAEPS